MWEGGGGTGGLEQQQAALALQTAGVAHERAVGTDDAVAGHHDGHGIVVASLRHGPRRTGIAYGFGQHTVRHPPAVGDALQRLPHTLPEWRARQAQGQGKSAALLTEILVELPAHHGLQRGICGRGYGIHGERLNGGGGVHTIGGRRHGSIYNRLTIESYKRGINRRRHSIDKRKRSIGSRGLEASGGRP